MKKIFGNTIGLKANQIRRLENLYRRRAPVQYLISPEIVKDMGRLSFEIHRQVALLIDRQGRVDYVIVGNHQGVVIPDLSEYRTAPGRLKGLRCIHTHLKEESLSRDDLTDLVMLRLDMMSVVTLDPEGTPRLVFAGHILPESAGDKPYRILPPLQISQLDIGCLELIQAIETELGQFKTLVKADKGGERAVLISVTSASKQAAADSAAELKELALSNGIDIAGTVIQYRKSADSRFLMGRGKLQELNVTVLQKGASLVIFDQELNPSQMRSITDQIDVKVIDRTQLILDIFARRAQSREGKLQVELAQLKYLLPRLITKNTAMSRLTGGIGGRGPGETKLEINRRRARARIGSLENELETVRKQRKQQKSKRVKKGLPIISIIGYTNAGKSTLLNAMTKSQVLVESKMFATLDPSSRRLRFPKDTQVIITDTVGFIKDLPKDLVTAFRATLEELGSADLLLHVIDISNPRFEEQISSVEQILSDLQVAGIPTLRVLNKTDLADAEKVVRLTRTLDGIPVSALNTGTLMPLIEKMEDMIHLVISTPDEPDDSDLTSTVPDETETDSENYEKNSNFELTDSCKKL